MNEKYVSLKELELLCSKYDGYLPLGENNSWDVDTHATDIDKALQIINALSGKLNLEEAYALLDYWFETDDTWDLDTTLKYCLEDTPGWPHEKLFSDEREFTLLVILRQRCYMLGILPSQEMYPNLHAVLVNYSNEINAGIDHDRILTNTLSYQEQKLYSEYFDTMN